MSLSTSSFLFLVVAGSVSSVVFVCDALEFFGRRRARAARRHQQHERLSH